jgi:hypothetical protein
MEEYNRDNTRSNNYRKRPDNQAGSGPRPARASRPPRDSSRPGVANARSYRKPAGYDSEHEGSNATSTYQKAVRSREKFLELGRDAARAGDNVGAENFYQHAEHYTRVINLSKAQQHRQQSHNTRGEESGEDTFPASDVE